MRGKFEEGGETFLLSSRGGTFMTTASGDCLSKLELKCLKINKVSRRNRECRDPGRQGQWDGGPAGYTIV